MVWSEHATGWGKLDPVLDAVGAVAEDQQLESLHLCLQRVRGDEDRSAWVELEDLVGWGLRDGNLGGLLGAGGCHDGCRLVSKWLFRYPPSFCFSNGQCRPRGTLL